MMHRRIEYKADHDSMFHMHLRVFDSNRLSTVHTKEKQAEKTFSELKNDVSIVVALKGLVFVLCLDIVE